MSRFLYSFSLVLLLSSGCTDGGSVFRTTPAFYPTAEQNYNYGLKELKSKNWLTAQQFFQHVKSSFAFSRWATLAELGIADSEMGNSKYTEAIDDYKAFIRAHPSHERVQDGYAAFRIGEAFHKQIPSDWFIMPPSYEKDQGPVNDALRELGAFQEQFADSPYAKKARDLYEDCVRRLADHEIYVANFYLRLGKPHSAIGRLEGVMQKFPGARREPETMMLLGRTYLKMDKPVEARRVFVKLATEHANDSHAEKARDMVKYIDKHFPTLADGPDPTLKKKRQLEHGPELPDTGETVPGALSPTPTSPATTSPSAPSNTSPANPPPAQ